MMIFEKIKYFISKTGNQMLIGFILVMTIVLLVAQLSTYFSLSRLLRKNSQKYATTIVEQLEGRLNTLLEEIDNRTLELSLDRQIQSILYSEKMGKGISLNQRLIARDIFTNVKRFSPMIKSINLYSLQQSVYPIENLKLSQRLKPEWLAEANEKSGKLVWLGLDPFHPQDLMAIRQVKIVNDKYKKGGYLLIRVVK
ncbi:MAG: hypothetical protein ACOCQN_02595, partial [Halanaerobiaceae bacterium]